MVDVRIEEMSDASTWLGSSHRTSRSRTLGKYSPPDGAHSAASVARGEWFGSFLHLWPDDHASVVIFPSASLRPKQRCRGRLPCATPLLEIRVMVLLAVLRLGKEDSHWVSWVSSLG
jgi:hypothetical protein